jgi:hypothetical protein
MTPVRLLIGCLVLAGAGFGLWKLADQSGDQKPLIELPEKVDSPMMSGDVALLERFTLEQPRYGISVRVDKQDEQWMITEPLVDLPEPMAISYTLNVLFGEDWQIAPEDWAGQSHEDLGLEPAAALIELRYSNGDTELLKIGAEEQTGRWRVAERNGELFRFPISAFRQLVQPTVLWRDHRLQPFGVNVDKVVWEPIEGQRLELEREGSRWYLRQPFSSPVSEQAFPFLMQMLGWRVDSMGSVPSSSINFEKPLGVLTVTQASSTVRLEVNRDGITSDQRDFPISYSERAFHFLRLDVDEIRSNRVVDLDTSQISSVQVEYGDSKRVYRKRPEGWIGVDDDAVIPEQSAFIAALVEHGALLERGEQVALPEGAPSGRILYSISRTPQERGSTILQWWVDDQDRNVVAPSKASGATVSSVNFELGVRELFGL